VIKILYVLTSDDSDYYFERMFLSITSLRLRTPNAFISLLIDNITKINITGKRKKILDLINEIISITIDERFDKKARSRFLKTSMRQHVAGDFVYIDSDTIIADDISSVANVNIDIGAVLDAHVFLSEYEKYYPAKLNRMRKASAKIGFDSCFDSNIRYNGGVILCKDCTASHNLFNEWHRLWLYSHGRGMITDQQSFNQANFNLGNIIEELDGIWNCQILDNGALRYLHDAKIIHYFATQTADKPFLLANKKYIEYIKSTGSINSEIRTMLENPKTLFASNTRLILVDKSLYAFYDSAIFGAGKRLYYTKMGNIIEFIFYRIRKYIFTPLRKKLAREK